MSAGVTFARGNDDAMTTPPASFLRTQKHPRKCKFKNPRFRKEEFEIHKFHLSQICHKDYLEQVGSPTGVLLEDAEMDHLADRVDLRDNEETGYVFKDLALPTRRGITG